MNRTVLARSMNHRPDELNWGIPVESLREAVRTLGPTGVVAIRCCGHWWSYLFPMGVKQMHDLATLNYRQPCPFCTEAHRKQWRPVARPILERTH